MTTSHSGSPMRVIGIWPARRKTFTANFPHFSRTCSWKYRRDVPGGQLNQLSFCITENHQCQTEHIKTKHLKKTTLNSRVTKTSSKDHSLVAFSFQMLVALVRDAF